MVNCQQSVSCVSNTHVSDATAQLMPSEKNKNKIRIIILIILIIIILLLIIIIPTEDTNTSPPGLQLKLNPFQSWVRSNCTSHLSSSVSLSLSRSLSFSLSLTLCLSSRPLLQPRGEETHPVRDEASGRRRCKR